VAEKTTQEVTDALNSVLQEHPDLLRNHRWKEFAEALNARGITTTTGLSWDENNVKAFIRRPILKTEVEDVTSEGSEANPTEPLQEEPESTEEPAAASTTLAPVIAGSFIERLTPEFIEDLEKIREQWIAQQGATEEAAKGERPKFKRGKETSTRTVRLGNQLIGDAEEYARTHRAETGGTFSGLVELLLWERLGRKSKYLSDAKKSDSAASREEE
jgi:hypothetical protein